MTEPHDEDALLSAIENDPVIASWRGAEDEARRLKSLKPSVRSRHLLTTVWCEYGKCPVSRIYKRRTGKLVICSSEANISDLRDSVIASRDWSKREAFWLTPELRSERLSIVCDCLNTVARLVSVAKLADTTKRNVSINEVLA